MNMQEITNKFMKNPMAMLSQRYNIPQNLNNPNDIIQHLLNTGQISQNQYNSVRQQVKNMANGNYFNIQR